jgi:transposase
MKKADGRKFTTETQQRIRYAAIELRKSGKTYVEIANFLDIHYTAIIKWWKLYEKKGYDGLVIGKRGVKQWVNCRLKYKQMEELRRILIQNTPDQLNLNFSLWTRQAIQNLIIKLWGISVSLVTVGRYMKRLGFTPQKPIKRAYEQNPKAVRKWLKKDYPNIVKKAIKENAEIHWLDETGLSSQSNYIRSYSPRGKTPILQMKAKRLSINIISSISKLGKMRFMTYEQALNTKTFINFVSRLCKDVNRKIFIILDNLAVHHSKKFVEWMKQQNNIVAFYLPSYSPELNPDERLNRDLKTHFQSGITVKSKAEFKKKAVSFLRGIQKMPFHIKNYFNSNFVRYAA